MQDEEKESKMKGFMKKAEALLAEIVDEMIDDEMKEMITSKLKKAFGNEKIPFTTSHLKAFYEGMSMMMAAKGEEEVIPMLLLTVKAVIRDKENSVSKVANDAMNGL